MGDEWGTKEYELYLRTLNPNVVGWETRSRNDPLRKIVVNSFLTPAQWSDVVEAPGFVAEDVVKFGGGDIDLRGFYAERDAARARVLALEDGGESLALEDVE